MALWTAYVIWDALGETEEVDVHADTERDARTLVVDELEEDYEPGWRIAKLEERVPEVMGWSW